MTITKVEGTAAQLEALHRALADRQLNQSSLLPAIADAIERAGDGTAEVDEWDITDRGTLHHVFGVGKPWSRAIQAAGRGICTMRGGVVESTQARR